MHKANTRSCVILFTCFCSQFSLAQSTTIVSPNALADVEGDGNLILGCCPSPFRFQQFFPAEDFDSLPKGGALITSIAWRPDGVLVDTPREITLFDTLFRFSTTDSGLLSTTFSENIGEDETTVRTGTFMVSTENSTLPNGTKEFDYVIEFDTPFFYDRDLGDLLWDWTGSLEAESFADGFRTPTDIVFSSPPSPNGARFGGIVVEFTFAQKGDFDGDLALTVEDIDLLTTAVASMYDRRFDVNNDRILDVNDRESWVHDLKGTWYGDANLDGEFNSGDLVQVFQAGHYEDGIEMNSGWAEGDWNGDGDFGTGDLVLAFQDGGFETGPRVLAVAVPEPTTVMFLVFVIVGSVAIRRRSGRSSSSPISD